VHRHNKAALTRTVLLRRSGSSSRHSPPRTAATQLWTGCWVRAKPCGLARSYIRDHLLLWLPGPGPSDGAERPIRAQSKRKDRASGPEGCRTGSGNEDPVQGEQIPVWGQASRGLGVAPWAGTRSGEDHRPKSITRTEPVSWPGDPKASYPFDLLWTQGHSPFRERPP
jgi:hypothetical protein